MRYRLSPLRGGKTYTSHLFPFVFVDYKSTNNDVFPDVKPVVFVYFDM